MVFYYGSVNWQKQPHFRKLCSGSSPSVLLPRTQFSKTSPKRTSATCSGSYTRCSGFQTCLPCGPMHHHPHPIQDWSLPSNSKSCLHTALSSQCLLGLSPLGEKKNPPLTSSLLPGAVPCRLVNKGGRRPQLLSPALGTIPEFPLGHSAETSPETALQPTFLLCQSCVFPFISASGYPQISP